MTGLLLVLCLSVIYVTQKLLAHWRALKSVGFVAYLGLPLSADRNWATISYRNHPGYRTLLPVGTVVNNFLPRLRGITPGSNHYFVTKHSSKSLLLNNSNSNSHVVQCSRRQDGTFILRYKLDRSWIVCYLIIFQVSFWPSPSTSIVLGDAAAIKVENILIFSKTCVLNCRTGGRIIARAFPETCPPICLFGTVWP